MSHIKARLGKRKLLGYAFSHFEQKNVRKQASNGSLEEFKCSRCPDGDQEDLCDCVFWSGYQFHKEKHITNVYYASLMQIKAPNC